MESPNMEAPTSNIYQFRIKLKYSRPSIWRRIQVPETYTFYDLHCAIQDAMGWLDCHMHQFDAKDPATGQKVLIGHPLNEDMEILDEKDIKLPEYFPSIKTKVNYEYDFGDGWDHTIVLENILPKNEQEQYPKCTGGKRACPPEDIGGVSGFDEFVKTMADPNHEEYREYKEWYERRYGVEFNANAFDHSNVVFKSRQAPQ